MDYELCWNILNTRLKEHERKAKKDPNGWVTLLTTQVILEMMSDIEKEVRDND